MSSDPARLPDSMRALRLTQLGTAAALATARVPPPSPAQGESPVPSSSADPFTAQELAAWRGLLEVHARAIRQLDVHLQTGHGLTLSQCEVLLLLDDAPGERLRMTELADAALLSRSACTRLVDRLQKLGYATRRAATDDGRGLYAHLTETGRRVIAPARATHREGVRAAFLDHLRATDLVALGDIWARARAGPFPSSDPTAARRRNDFRFPRGHDRESQPVPRVAPARRQSLITTINNKEST
jgi:DNA-binding MarR family transcriptional regulator